MGIFVVCDELYRSRALQWKHITINLLEHKDLQQYTDISQQNGNSKRLNTEKMVSVQYYFPILLEALILYAVLCQLLFCCLVWFDIVCTVFFVGGLLYFVHLFSS